MATIGPKQADAATLLDDIVNTATSVTQDDGVTAAWERIDGGVVQNVGGDDNWRNNGAVLHHVESGMYLTLYLQGYRYQDQRYDPDSYHTGIRIVHSNDYDLANSVPFGKTDVHNGADAMQAEVGNHRETSFVWQSGMPGYYDGDWGSGVYWRDGDAGANAFRTNEANYVLSIGADWLNVAAFSNDPNNGCAGLYTFEHVGTKFWNDGNEPYVAYCKTNTGWRGARSAQYGFQHFNADQTFNSNFHFDTSGFDGSAWGIVNPDVNDDTFFFRRPVCFMTQNKRIPVGYVENTIANDTDEGGAHGDVVTHNGVDYFIFRQSGGKNNQMVSLGLRNE